MVSPGEAGRRMEQKLLCSDCSGQAARRRRKRRGSTRPPSWLRQLLGFACIPAVALQLFLWSSYLIICASKCVLKWTPAVLRQYYGRPREFGRIYCSRQFYKAKAQFPLCGTFQVMTFPLIGVLILLLFVHLSLKTPNSPVISWLTQLNLNSREELRHMQPKERARSHG